MPDINKQVLEKYISGRCTPEELKAVEDWFFLLGNQYKTEMDEGDFQEAALFQKIKSRIERDNSPVSLTRVKTMVKFQRLAIACCLLVLIMASFLYYRNVLNSPQESERHSVHLVLDNHSMSVSRQSLPDGSTVWLNPGATLEYRRPGNSDARSVVLSGEAFFDVSRDSMHPFIIRTGDMETRVIGTSFNVLALPQSKSFKVSVVTGKVQVSVKNEQGILQSILLLPKQQSNFDLSSRELVYNDISETDLKKDYWKPFSLNFEDAEMNEVKAELEKAFNLRIVFSDSALAKCRIRVSFNNYKLTQVLDILEKLLDVECRLGDDNTLTIEGAGCK